MPKAEFDDVSYNLDVNSDPPKELLEYAKEKWGETDETRPIKIAELRTIIQGRYHVPYPIPLTKLIRYLIQFTQY